MSTRDLVWWVALVGGAEAALRGYLAGQAALFHAGAWLVFAAVATSAWRARGVRRAVLAGVAGAPVLLSALAWLGIPAPEHNPWAAFWREHAAEREVLQGGAPGDAALLFGTRIALDAHGFREEPSPPRGAFRIVAIGGSTTFGATRSEDELPWPAVLEREIAALDCATPVSVRNAGRPGRGLASAVRRFETDIAPLDPDLVIVYPAPADLASLSRQFDEAVPAVPPPPQRASELLWRVESTWRDRDAKHRFGAALAAKPPPLDLEEIPLARAYRRLLLETRRRGIDVALSTAGLAVDEGSPDAEIRGHEALESRTRRIVLSNRLHDRLVRGIGATYRAILLDAGGRIDGSGEEAFLDLFHPSQAGRERLAAAMLEGLRSRLAATRPGCPEPARDP